MKKRNAKNIRRKNPINIHDLYCNVILTNYISKLRYNSNIAKEEQLYEICIKYLREIIKNSEITQLLGEGTFGKVFKIFVNKKLFISNQFIYPGIYAIKIYIKPLSLKCFKSLEIYSKYGLIPKIYLHNRCFTLMKYIKGKKLSTALTETDDIENILKNRQKLIDIFHKLIPYSVYNRLDFGNDDNFIVSDDFKHVYLIDPCT